MILAAAAVMCLWAAMAGPAASGQSQCVVVKAAQSDALITAGCTSPVGFCAGGTVAGNHGLRGTSSFSATSFDPIPNDPLGRVAVPGTSTYTTDAGVLTINDVSVFDTARGTFAGVGRVAGGTGRFAGATGDIFTTGRVGADGVSFVTDVSGDLCLP
ncbi:MAG TPA: hypothetical protein VF064_17065 [Pyrinomonadaceae bacterium]